MPSPGHVRPAILVLAVISIAGIIALGRGTIVQAERGSPAGSTCLEDSLEDNDSQETASVVTVPFRETGLRVCPNDSDWYSFVLGEGESVQVDALFEQALGDIDIALYNERGDLAAISNNPTDNEKIAFFAPSSGAYAVEVYLFQNPPANGNGYTLEITSPAQPPTPLGDVNCDSLINSVDAALVLQLTAGLLSTLPCQTAADVNDDGNADSRDAAVILQFDAGLIKSIPP